MHHLQASQNKQKAGRERTPHTLHHSDPKSHVAAWGSNPILPCITCVGRFRTRTGAQCPGSLMTHAHTRRECTVPSYTRTITCGGSDPAPHDVPLITAPASKQRVHKTATPVYPVSNPRELTVLGPHGQHVRPHVHCVEGRRQVGQATQRGRMLCDA